MISNPGFDRGFSCRKPVGQNGVLTLCMQEMIGVDTGDRPKFETSQGPLDSSLWEVAESSRTPPGFGTTSLVVSDRSLKLGVLMFGFYR
ncbi:hypothetical protein CRG98_000664 [Punica granatum]|uniref:Uncharacterized protein n=1 Tax=Punica granatum TaxID=22663 RepID=A0A2I0LE45_PUNGR|nr:hypothetical protein CRG98_000664 [Punica granatum]